MEENRREERIEEWSTGGDNALEGREGELGEEKHRPGGTSTMGARDGAAWADRM